MVSNHKYGDTQFFDIMKASYKTPGIYKKQNTDFFNSLVNICKAETNTILNLFQRNRS